MSITASALRELHRIHQQLGDLRSRLERGPKQQHARDASVRKMELDLEQARDALKKLQVLRDQKQLQYDGRQEHVRDRMGKLNACNNNRDYQALKMQIAADKQANEVLADEILDAMERIEELKEKVKKAESNLQRARREAEEVQARVAAEQRTLHEELARVQGELRQAEAALPADFKREYDRITRARGQEALAAVEGETCGGCYRLLTPQTMNELYLSRPVFCKSCGCLLYLPEDRIPERE